MKAPDLGLLQRPRRGPKGQFGLRTTLIVLGIAPPILAMAWQYREYPERSGIWDAKFPVHSVIGIVCLLSYATTFVLHGIVLGQWRDWSMPPRESFWSQASLAATMLFVLCGILWFVVPF